jgi:hypothetical protein
MTAHCCAEMRSAGMSSFSSFSWRESCADSADDATATVGARAASFPHHDATNEDEDEVVCLVGERVQDAPDQRGCAAEMREFLRPFCRSLYKRKWARQTRTQISVENCLPPSRLTSGTSVTPEMTVGMPMSSPENVALPPRYPAYLPLGGG